MAFAGTLTLSWLGYLFCVEEFCLGWFFLVFDKWKEYFEFAEALEDAHEGVERADFAFLNFFD